jgi:hypothetical protein
VRTVNADLGEIRWDDLALDGLTASESPILPSSGRRSSGVSLPARLQ